MSEMKNIDEIKRINREVLAYLHARGYDRQEIARRMGMKIESVSATLSSRGFSEAAAHRWSVVFGLNEEFLLTGCGPVMDESATNRDLLREVEHLRSVVRGQKAVIEQQKSRILELESNDVRSRAMGIR